MRKTLMTLSALVAVSVAASSPTRTEASPLVNPTALSGAIDELSIIDNVQCRPGWRYIGNNRCARRGAVIVIPGRQYMREGGRAYGRQYTREGGYVKGGEGRRGYNTEGRGQRGGAITEGRGQRGGAVTEGRGGGTQKGGAQKGGAQKGGAQPGGEQGGAGQGGAGQGGAGQGEQQRP